MKKLMMAAAAASCLMSGMAFAQSDPTCVMDSTDPNCVCVTGENDADCVGGVHRGPILGAAAETVIHGVGSALLGGAGL
jgi:hypothetical protein